MALLKPIGPQKPFSAGLRGAGVRRPGRDVPLWPEKCREEPGGGSQSDSQEGGSSELDLEKPRQGHGQVEGDGKEFFLRENILEAQGSGVLAQGGAGGLAQRPSRRWLPRLLSAVC